jgi:AcrR family transcriptional regulator
VGGRRELILDTAIALLGDGGVHAVTHRAVDGAADLAAGSTSNYFRSRDALLEAIVERFAARETANWDGITAASLGGVVGPTTPAGLAEAMAAFARDATGPHRTLTLARYAILVETAHHPALRERLLAAGSRVNAWFTDWLRIAGSADPERAAPVLMNHWTGLVLHQLAMPDPAFDPLKQCSVIVDALLSRFAVEGASTVEGP